MGKQLPVVVLKDFETYRTGQAVLMPMLAALLAQRRRQVRITRKLEAPASPPSAPARPEPPAPLPVLPAQTKAVEPESVPDTPKSKRTYKRRDMQAEEPTALVVEPPAFPAPINATPVLEPEPVIPPKTED